MAQQELEESLHRQLKQIYYYLVKMGAKRQDAEDVIQDTAYKFLLYIDSVPVQNVEGWLFRVAVNGYYDLSKTRSRREKIIWRFFDEDRVEKRTPEAAIITNEMSSDIRRVLDQLKVNHREILLLKYSADLSLREIGSLLNLKEAAVKSTLHRARASFIKKYGRGQDDQRNRESI
ncbi:RNA polymerase sigma factor [Jeotgalibacillus sp. ET6]|uniref:RNA polymerase sigma factor n=1 Tax=Jeotgalibacillus sp. ET6 TaxID=3037260 RepID=UPI0024182E61|nr:RNA polymerase sigma factor [Jeotgalibacillus sp. ET6]MDG5472145.1 RNA polymerase sigma factor [Jeotgalibacillus sp. ET6]